MIGWSMLDLAARFDSALQAGNLVFYQSEAHTRTSHGVEVYSFPDQQE